MPLFFSMTFAEALVIYLSAGAPFGVMAYFDSRSRGVAAAFVRASIAVIIWPIIGVTKLKTRFRHHSSSQRSDTSFEFLQIAGHSDPTIGAACLDRANERRARARDQRAGLLETSSSAASKSKIEFSKSF